MSALCRAPLTLGDSVTINTDEVFGTQPLLNVVRGKIPESDGPLGRKPRWHRSHNSECDEVCTDLDLVCKCAMDWTLLCNLDQLLALRFV
jgi:hypothetical protein